MADNAHHAIPGHVAIIMDGNGRWAQARGLPRIAGHREGVKAVRRTIQAAIDQGVRFLTLFAFSSENWQRPPAEVADLTFLLKHYLRAELNELHEQGVCLRTIGDRDRFGPNLAAELDAAIEKTANNKRLTLVMALSYGGRADIVAAARAGLLSTDGIPDPDLLIRTSGEMRISNFLLWQTAYAEMIFTDVLWPDFGADDFAQALGAFATRERRFGARPV
jgi:undecaprenyl diphosphate synthase